MIYVQLVSEKWDLVSAFIRYTTRSWPSHAEFYDTETNTTLGARIRGGVKIRDYSKDHYSKVERFTAAGIRDAYEFAKTQIGKPYDFSAVSGILLDRNWHNDVNWFCSELVAVSFEKAGHPLLSTRPSAKTYRITPRDLLLSRNLYYIEPKTDPKGEKRNV